MNQLSDATQSPAWPGIRVVESTCGFFPRVKEWGEPVCPLFLRGADYAEAPNIPPPGRAAFPCGRHHAVRQETHRLHEAEDAKEAVGEGAREH